jgi:UDP-N-acetylglucosamine:LPS N-acetylglucosamine transferase
LWAEVVRLAEDEATLADMRAAALSRARPDAASEIAADVERLLATRAGVG